MPVWGVLSLCVRNPWNGFEFFCRKSRPVIYYTEPGVFIKLLRDRHPNDGIIIILHRMPKKFPLIYCAASTGRGWKVKRPLLQSSSNANSAAKSWHSVCLLREISRYYWWGNLELGVNIVARISINGIQNTRTVRFTQGSTLKWLQRLETSTITSRYARILPVQPSQSHYNQKKCSPSSSAIPWWSFHHATITHFYIQQPTVKMTLLETQ